MKRRIGTADNVDPMNESAEKRLKINKKQSGIIHPDHKPPKPKLGNYAPADLSMSLNK